MRRKNDPYQRMQDDAHDLLQEWASGPHDGPREAQAGMDRVDGGRADMTAPERYAHAHDKWDSLDRAVRHVRAMNRDLGVALEDHYWHGWSKEACADRASLSVRQWRERLDTARSCFIVAYRMANPVRVGREALAS